jgi:hypothetical protein
MSERTPKTYPITSNGTIHCLLKQKTVDAERCIYCDNCDGKYDQKVNCANQFLGVDSL